MGVLVWKNGLGVARTNAIHASKRDQLAPTHARHLHKMQVVRAGERAGGGLGGKDPRSSAVRDHDPEERHAPLKQAPRRADRLRSRRPRGKNYAPR
jgi:hypothetical protein